MFTTTYKKSAVRTFVAAAALLTGTLLTGCSDDPAAASSGSDEASPTSPADRALAYSQCMRENGVPNFPDPQADGGGIRISPQDGLDPNSQEFQDAQQACQDLAPQGGPGGTGGGGTIDSTKAAEWAQCIRDNGVPKFPDPEINGSSLNIDIMGAGVDPGDPKFQQAMQTCQSKYPGGAVQFGGGGGQ
ncbi:hypothetical protein ACFV7R_30910 [Streptomyces sp. NPDC059866]|uniref:hypothetical protein n=1 Tax=Streptomyces sp. NPDC059866 TaxID=3346978 RepID=UPI003651E046